MNQPYQRANKDSIWNGMAIGAGAGAGMAGAAQTGMAFMAKRNPVTGVMLPGGGIMNPTTSKQMSRYMRQFGSKGRIAGRYGAGALLGAGIGTAIDYFNN